MRYLSNSLLAELIEEGNGLRCDHIKIYLFKHVPELFQKLDFYNDAIFSDPDLFSLIATLNQQKISDPEKKIYLQQMLFGYLPDDARPEAFEVITDHNGIVYFPEVGYLNTLLKNTKLRCQWSREHKTFTLVDNGAVVRFDFSPILYVPGTNIEVCQAQQWYHLDNYRVWRDDVLDTSSADDRTVHIDVDTIKSKHLDALGKAFKLVEKTSPEYFQCIVKVARKMVLFVNPYVRPFAAQTAPGMIFLSVKPEDNEVFFASEIVHQYGHNILFSVICNEEEYFNIPSWTPMPELYDNPTDHRTFFSAYHGLFTTSKTAECLEKIIDDKSLSERNQTEAVARYIDNFRRFNTGLNKTPLESILTEKGKDLYYTMEKDCRESYERKEDLLSRYKVSNQGFVFNFTEFLAEN